ncbi:MAG: UTP--glucose-1-phosphate uridylyltransferase [Mycoplasmataceae bacterium]|jgi:UTP--glucose-1-phosphate uridylyltransferase|nr:UTP--glucose-1-phosphate uridylyltransferase [Mycoplasmataceae bacterium]
MNSIKITKAVIPAAGLGSRFLPATKSIPKEMIPILDTPTIDLIVQEAAQSGITDILIIVSYTKYSIRHFYGRNKRLEKTLIRKKKHELCEKIRKIGTGVKIRFKSQLSPRGLGHAVYLARSFTKKQPFAVLLGDDIVLKNNGNTLPSIKQLMNVYDKYHSSVVGVKEVARKDVHQYGIIEPKKYINTKNKLCEIKSMVEKPVTNSAPSNLAITGRYILTPEIFKYLAMHKIGVGGEIQLTDALISLLSEQKVYALDYEGTRFDIGSKSGLVKASIDFALKDPDIHTEILDYILNLAKRLKK